MSTKTKIRYAVFSYNEDEQQKLCDYVETYDEDSAEEIVCEARADQITGVAAVLSADDLACIAENLRLPQSHPTTAAELRAALGMEPEEEEEEEETDSAGRQFDEE